MADLVELQRCFEAYLDSTWAARETAERCRDYFDGKQWSADEADVLRQRFQAPIVFNRVKPKVEALQGIERKSRRDPRAFPRTPKHAQGAVAATDALRFVIDRNDFDQIASDGFEDLLIEGTEAAIVDLERKGGENWIQIRRIPWDRFYYDPHSRNRDFSDAKYLGITLWMDLEDAQTMFPGSEDDLGSVMAQAGTGTHDDRNVWVDRARKRIRVNQHYYRRGRDWYLSYFTALVQFSDAKSPHLDEFGRTTCPIIAQSAYMDRENQRYGHVPILLDPQDEINHRRSKFLSMVSHRTVIAERGVIDDGQNVLRELAKPRGLVEINPGGGRFEIDAHSEIAQGQFALLNEAKGEIDGLGPNEVLGGESGASQSGIAILRRQQAGMFELGPIFDRHTFWKRRVYQAIWNRIRQYWTTERWIRVTDDERNVRFVSLNRKVTKGELILQRFGREAVEAVALDEQQRSKLFETAMVENDVEEMWVDILIDESQDLINIQQEQFAVIAELAKAYTDKIPFEMVLELSQLRDKDRVLKLMQEAQAAQAQSGQVQQGLDQGLQASEIEANLAKAARDRSEAIQKSLVGIS